MTAPSVLRCHSFSLHKDGNKPDEYEDAAASNPKLGRFAVADGASESSFADLWAKLLVEGFVRNRQRITEEWLAPLQQVWSEQVDHLELDWFAEEKRLLGAFATFLGLAFKKPKQDEVARWKAVSVGDACLFQIRENSLAASFPLELAEDFGNRPALLGSRQTTGQKGLAQAKMKIGRWKKGDRFFLMTDALAQWFLARHEEGRKPWESLCRRLAEPKSTAALTAYVEQLRGSGELKNDDVTLLVIDL